MSANYSCNDNQNYFVADGKTTSRVLQVPGGQSTISLAWNDSELVKENCEVNCNRVSSYLARKKNSDKEVSGKIGQRDNCSKRYSYGKNEKTKKDYVEYLLKDERVSSNRFATGSNMNSGNVITDRSTTRVVAPPGGRSQVFFG